MVTPGIYSNGGGATSLLEGTAGWLSKISLSKCFTSLGAMAYDFGDLAVIMLLFSFVKKGGSEGGILSSCIIINQIWKQLFSSIFLPKDQWKFNSSWEHSPVILHS